MQQTAIEEKAKGMEPAARQKYLNDYSVAQAQSMLARWKKLATYLIVKYNDMAVKPDENGQFKRGTDWEQGLSAQDIRLRLHEES